MNDHPEQTLSLDGRALALLTVGHTFIDMSQGAVAALMPFFKAQHDLNYKAAAGLVLASSLASSVVQPLFGLFADRVSAPWLLPASILTAGVGLVAAALAPAYGLAVAAVGLCGLGVAAFHPEAARLVYLASGSHRTTGMSYFSVGGGVGFAAAPLVVAGVLGAVGPAGLPVLLIPALLLACLFGNARARLGRLAVRPGFAVGQRGGPLPAQWPAFTLLGVIIAVRSGAFVGLSAFLALYWVNFLGGTATGGNIALAAVLASGVIGALLGGRLADRWGRRAVICGSHLAAATLLGLFGASGGWMTAALVLAPIGIAMSGGSSALIVLGQEYLPGRVGVASGVTIGLAVSCGGAAAPLLGWAADTYGVGMIPGLLAGLTLTAAVLAFALPRPGGRVGREGRPVPSLLLQTAPSASTSPGQDWEPSKQGIK